MAAPSRPESVFCSVAFLQRHPDMTPEQFYHHWEHTHGPLVKPWAQKHGIISYTQVHTTPALKQGAAPVGPETADAKPSLADYDGCAIMEATSQEAFAAAFQDEYYLTVIEPDERKFLNKKFGMLRARGEPKKII